MSEVCRVTVGTADARPELKVFWRSLSSGRVRFGCAHPKVSVRSRKRSNPFGRSRVGYEFADVRRFLLTLSFVSAVVLHERNVGRRSLLTESRATKKTRANNPRKAAIADRKALLGFRGSITHISEIKLIC